MRRSLGGAILVLVLSLAGASPALATTRTRVTTRAAAQGGQPAKKKPKSKSKKSTTTTTKSSSGKTSLAFTGTFQGSTLSGTAVINNATCNQLGPQTLNIGLSGYLGKPTFLVSIFLR